MSGIADLLAFSGVMALAQFSPGPDMVLLTRTSLRDGSRAGMAMAMGIGCGLAVHAGLAMGGLALVFERLPALKLALTWAAAAYLLWLAWRMGQGWFVAGHAGVSFGKESAARTDRPFRRGLWCNLLNPKVAVFLMAVSAPFLKGGRPGWWPAALWVVVVGQGMVLWMLWAVLLQWAPLRHGYERAAVAIDAAFALLLVALAGWLVIG